MGVPSKAEIDHFVATFLYSSEAFLVDEVTAIDRDQGIVEARMDTTRPLPVSRFQRGDALVHPRHVSAPDLMDRNVGVGKPDRVDTGRAKPGVVLRRTPHDRSVLPS